MSARAGRLAVVLGCAAFLVLSLPYLDRLPPIHNDEPTILAPGVDFFTHGVFGLRMLDGLGGADRHYLEVMPAMSLLEGAVARLAGVGVWQMRLVSVLLGAATLALAGVLALRLAGPIEAALTAGFLLLWQWTPGGAEFLPTGIPLVDVSRIARYDILAAPLGLGALLVFASSPRRSPRRVALAAGAFVGLATLATPYGVFWGVALLVLLALRGRGPGDVPGHAFRDAALLAAAATAVVLPWLAFALAHWTDLVAQFARHAGRFDLTDPAFYLDSLRHEVQRYQLGARNPATYGRVGFWLLVAGVPAAFLWLARRAARSRDRRPLLLLVPCATLPLLLALLVNVKRFYYLAGVVPLFAVLLAWGCGALLRAPRWPVRTAALAVLALAALQGGTSLAHAYRRAAGIGAPGPFLARLRAGVAPGANRIVGPHAFWFPFRDRAYLSFTVPVSVMAADHCSLETALGRVAPDAVLLTPYVMDAYTRGRPGPATGEELRAVLDAVGLRRTATLADNAGVRVEIWQAVAGRIPTE